MKLIAHRGLYNKKSEQNTYKAFIDAIKSQEYSGFECDIRKTLDHKYIVNHDAYIKDDLIKKTNYKDLKLYNHTSLIEVLKLNTNKIKLIEIKDLDIDFGYLNKLFNKYSDNLYVMSFHNSVINKLSLLNHNYKLGILNYVLNSESSYNYDFICLLDNLCNDSKIEAFLKNNIEVFIYGILSNKFNHGNKVYYIVDDIKLKEI